MFRPHTLYIGIRIVRWVKDPVFAMQDQDVSDVVTIKNQMAMKYIGIDVSKATFVVAYSSGKDGEKMNPQPFKVQGEAILRLRQKRTVIRQLTKQITAMSNLRGSLACLPVPDKGAIHTVDETIKFLEKKRDRLQSELTDLVEVEFSRQLALLTTIKGIGITLATALIITTGGFTYFQNAKQVSRYLGICPTYEQSGTSVNIKGHINRNGDAYTRGLLYIAAWPASRFNAQCKETYTRLRQNGKSGKLAMIAVANKLVRQAFAVVAHDKEYVDGFVSNRP